MLPVTDRNKRIYFGDYKLNDENALQAVRCAVGDAEATRPPADLSGRGIVIPGGGDKYLPGVWINVRMLRHHGCDLPIQVWHLGPGEMPERMRQRLVEHGVECVDARKLRDERWPHRKLNGWELKAYALLHCPFAEVMLLDADNVAVRDPSFLFDDPAYMEQGAIFWPDRGRWKRDNPIWKLTGIPYRDEPEIESGQIVIDKRRCWQALLLANWFNEHSDYWYKLMHGDKDTFRLAWRAMGQRYALGDLTIRGGVFVQKWRGQSLFQHTAGQRKMQAGRPLSLPDDYEHRELVESFAHEAFGILASRITNVHCRNSRNVGDRYCAVASYFDLGADLLDWGTASARCAGAVVILGGGGLAYPPAIGQIEQIIAAKPRLLIAWGIGTNTHWTDDDDYPAWLGRCDLVGVRDWGRGYRWVPCPSCMSPLFDRPPAPKHRIVVYQHFERKPLPVAAPLMKNDVRTMEEAIAFLASGEIVVTNSYHGMVWATWLGRRVVYRPFSSKFSFWRYPASRWAENEPLEAAIGRAVVYPHALEESREANRKYYEEVKQCLA